MNCMGSDEKRFFWRWMCFGLALHFVAAVFSIGHQAADEYFQILEFTNFKLGGTPIQDLPVEYAERMRPWFQPGVYFLMAKAWSALGIMSPFTWVFSFRLFAGFIGWVSGVLLAWHTLPWFSSSSLRRALILLTSLLWFMPVLHVRPSSEGLGGSFFVVGLALAIASEGLALAIASASAARAKRRIGLSLFSGVFMGLAFESRFQIGVMIAGFGAWWLLLGHSELKERVKWILPWSLGLLLTLALGRVVDAWGYGEWAWAPWNYVNYNLVRGEVNRYGPSPWWDVLRMSATEAWPILGTLLLLLCVTAWIRWPKSVVTWSTASLFIVHCAISHKELRFFFPITHAAPVLILLAVTRRDGNFTSWFKRFSDGRIGKLTLRFLIGLNLIALSVLLFMPLARNVQFYQAYDSWMREDPTARSEVYTLGPSGKDPYEILGSNTYFYKPESFVLTRVADWPDLERLFAEKPVYLFLMKARVPDEAPLEIREACAPVIRTLPSWLFEAKWLNFGNWMSRAQAWSLFECKRG